jgi:cytoskeletal protein CcmA (bactofilin family)
LFIDGQVDGTVSFPNSVVTVGPNAKVKAEITAREVVIRGKVEGKISGSEKIQVWNSARVHGDMKSERISVEEGAELHGSMEVGKLADRSQDATKNANTKKVEAGKQSSTGAAVAGAD